MNLSLDPKKIDNLERKNLENGRKRKDFNKQATEESEIQVFKVFNGVTVSY